jgi:integrase
LTTVERYAFPKLGTLRVDHINAPDIYAVLAPIWTTKPETARRVRQRVGAVMDWAKANGHRTGDNPVELAVIGLQRQGDRVEHHAALPFTKVPAFLPALRASDSREATRLAFELLILTVARTGEIIGAKPEEFDLDGDRVWTCPAGRMKAKRDHRVPLTPRCVEIVRRARELAGNSRWLFPGVKDKHLSNMVFLKALERMGVDDVTPHGFRSSFRDWAAEKTAFPREVVEMAMAHTVSDKVEAAYRRGDLFEKRRALMTAWTNYCTAERGKVVAIRSTGATAT